MKCKKFPAFIPTNLQNEIMASKKKAILDKLLEKKQLCRTLAEKLGLVSFGIVNVNDASDKTNFYEKTDTPFC